MAKKDQGALVQREEMQPVSPFAEMDKYFENFLRNPFSMPFGSMMTSAFPKAADITPSVDIFEDGNEVVVKACQRRRENARKRRFENAGKRS